MFVTNFGKYWYGIPILVAGGLFFYVDSVAGAASLRDIKLAEGYALLALAYMYLAMLAGPWFRAFPNFPKEILPERPARLWVEALFFALLHIYFAFFKLLGGFPGLPFLSGRYVFAIILALCGLVIVALMSSLSKRFPKLEYVGFVAGGFIITHAFLLGSHFKDLTRPLPLFFGGLIYVLCFLIIKECEVKMIKKFKWWPLNLGVWILTVAATAFVTFQFVPTSPSSSMGGHNMSAMTASSTMKHYSVSLNPKQELVPGKSTELELKIFRAETGAPVKDFQIVHEKLVHLVIVDEALEYYEHIHPEFQDDKFTVMANFPHAGSYRAYASFQPKGDEEKVFAYRFTVGEDKKVSINKITDADLEKTIDSYKISLAQENLNAAMVARGESFLKFTLKDATTGQGLGNLYPYLGAFGHLVMINAENYSYIHAHPLAAPVIPDDKTGPTVNFMVTGNVMPGIYKIFAQFAPDKKVITVPFTVEVK